MKTAVEFLLEKYKSQNTLLFADDFEQAKEMEKQQMIDCGNSCALMSHIHKIRVIKMSTEEIVKLTEEDNITFGEQYYNETYNK